MTKSLRARHGKQTTAAFLATVVLILSLEWLGLFEGANNYFYDLFFVLRGSRQPPREIVIGAIDENTLRTMGRWPLERNRYAPLLDRLELADIVAFDLIFSEPSEHDSEFAQAIHRHGRVVLSTYLETEGNVLNPVSSLNPIAKGHIHVELGKDGVARSVFHTIRYCGVALPSLSSAVFELISQRPFPRELEGQEPCTAAIIQADPMMINYYGGRGTFQHVPLVDILEGKWERSFFDGKTVLVGVTARGIDDGFLNPFMGDKNKIPGVELHANALANLMDGSFLRPVPIWLLWSAVVLLTGASFMVFVGSQALRGFFLWSCGLPIMTLALFLLFARMYVWVPPGALVAAISFPFAISCVLELRNMYSSLIQARKEWEEAFNTIDDGIYVQNLAGELERTNNTGREMLGEFLAAALQRKRAALSNGANNPEKRVLLNQEEAGEPLQTEELFDDAAARFYEIRSLPRTDAGGSVCGFVHVVRDITRRKQSEKEQRELERMLVQAQKMEAIGTLASGIAHDFNNILASIVGYTELACLKLPPDERNIRPRLEQVLKASERARDLITQILTFSRKSIRQPRLMQIRPILKETLKFFRSAAPKSIEIHERFRADCVVRIDPTQLHQVLMNLCTNAYHAMKEKGGSLSVSVEQVQVDQGLQAHGQRLPPGAYVKLTVSDTGHGIPEECGEKIFEPYFTTKVEGEGTGLGLATVRAIAQDHGGLVTFDSKCGQGTSFHFYLPRSRPGATEEEGSVGSGSITAGHGQILLVDDDPQTCPLVKEVLEELGYRVEAKISALEALEAFRLGPDQFDLVMTDLDMPGMTGMDLATIILQIRPNVPIVLCTGHLDGTISEKSSAIGIREVIRKPFHAADLSKVLSRLWDGDVSKGQKDPRTTAALLTEP